MTVLLIVCGVVFYAFGALVTWRVCDSHWGDDCSRKNRSYHWDSCGHLYAALAMAVFWLIGPPLYLLSLALWSLAVVVSDKLKPKKEDK